MNLTFEPIGVYNKTSYYAWLQHTDILQELNSRTPKWLTHKKKKKKKKFCATMRKMLFGAKVATGISLMRYNGFVNITFYVLTIEVRKVP